ncbi:hypothetical protein BsWGS_24779 [Bradybaena similaris]
MAFSGWDKSKSPKSGEKSDEFIPLTSDQDGPNLDSVISGGSLATGSSSTDNPPSQGSAADSVVVRSNPPALSRNSSLYSQDDTTARLSSIHDDVNKMFESDWRLEVDTLTTDPNAKGPASNVMGRESSKQALSELYHVDEVEFSRHRRYSYPHIHQPLRSLSNKSLTKAGKSHKPKKKGKKKRDKTADYPSQGAVKSPPIVELDEEGLPQGVEYSDDSGSSSVSDEELDDDDVGEEPVDHQPYPGMTTSPMMNIVPASPSLVGTPSTATSASSHKSLSPIKTPSPDEHSGQESFVTGRKSGHAQQLEAQITSDTAVLVNPDDEDEDEGLSDADVSIVWKSTPTKGVSRTTSLEQDSFTVTYVEEALPSQRPAHLALGGLNDVGIPSPVMSYTAPRRASLGGKVSFVLGDDAGYSNLPSDDTSDAGHKDAQPVYDQDDDKENVGRRKKRRGSESRRRGSSDGDMKDPGHALSKVSSAEESQSTRSGRRKHHHHHHEHFRTEDLIMRRQKGSEVVLSENFKISPTETEEANMLYKADLDEMTSHRFEDQRGIRRHKIARNKGALQSIVHIGKTHHEKKPRAPKKYDHSPHEVFVELDELHFGGDDMMEWREKARWIKFEEDVEEGAERWGKPHVASLSFHSLLELRRGLERGTLLLDLEATDLTSIIHSVVENMVIRDLVEEEVKGKLLRTLLLKHKHVSGRTAFLRRTSTHLNLASMDSSGKRHQQHDKGLLSSISQSSFGSTFGLNKSPSQLSIAEKKRKDGKAVAKLEMVKVDVDNNMTDKHSDGIHIGISPIDQRKDVQDIMRRIPKGSEATTVLVGQVDFLKRPAMAFVRLSEGRLLENLTEVPLPVRFIFILLGPEKGGMDYHEVGRSLSTLMSNQQFHSVAYRAETREDLLRAINNFLDDSIVLPPGDWDHRTLLPITHMARKRALMRQQKKQQLEEKEALKEKEEKESIPSDPLKRTGCLFGGVYNDIRRRYPLYLSDIKDAANLQSFKTTLFIFFTCLSPCIAFGGLLSEKTHSLMGVSETMVATSVFGMLFSLFSGQPLLIIGATGPVLVFEESLYKFCDSNGLEFLPMRFWIGLWVCAITTVAVALEGSFLIHYVTRFTEEIFAILISLIFIYEVVKKLMQIFSKNPLMQNYCELSSSAGHSYSNFSAANTTHWPPFEPANGTYIPVENITGTDMYIDEDLNNGDHVVELVNQPNTALLSLILIIGTFLIAYFLRVFRNSKFLGRSVRRAIGDFGVLISLLCMVILSVIMSQTYVQKLDITDPLTPTSPTRGWFINPMGEQQTTPLWLPFASALPGFLIFILLFMETQITEMILNKKERKLRKGSGYHIDQLILGVMTLLGGLFGLPWMCAATVRTVAHIAALSEYSRTHAPGVKPELLGVKEQRVTNFAVHLLIGVAVCAGPVLRAVPVPALFGIFLYLGVSTLSGVQMCERLKLLLMPVKYHPTLSYVRKVRTMQMHKFTLIQLACLIVLIVIKSTAASLAFPFMLTLLIPLRLKLMPKFFDHADLEELDNEEEEFELDEEDDPDFYQQAHMPI